MEKGSNAERRRWSLLRVWDKWTYKSGEVVQDQGKEY